MTRNIPGFILKSKSVLPVLLFLVSALFIPHAQASDDPEVITNHLNNVLYSRAPDDVDSLEWLKQRNKPDVVAPLIYALRYSRSNLWGVLKALDSITGTNANGNWFDWMLWQQAHPDIVPYSGFVDFQSGLFSRIDPNFKLFIYPGVSHEIRMEEIAWGGVRKDGIPALTNPKFIPASEADYLNDDDLVFGVAINGDARAYPYRIMDWHEMANDVVGGIPVSLAYCTLCGSGILFDTRVEGRPEPFVFGSSGFLYRSNKLMYDKQTNSLWQHFTGRPVVGKLTGSGIQLKVLPMATTSWKRWRETNPGTKVLSENTGFNRDYGSGKAYQDYFSSPDLMFPAPTENKAYLAKTRVFGLRMTGAEKAWPLDHFDGGQVINDRVGVFKIVLVGSSETRTVRAYRSGRLQFTKSDADLNSIKSSNGHTWQVTENALIGPEGVTLPRLPGHLAYWFAWSGNFDGPVNR